MQRLIRILSIIFTIIFLGTAGVLSYAYNLYYLNKVEAEQTFIIPKNTSTSEISDLFVNNKIVKNPLVFKVFAYIHLKQGRFIQPGEYLFEKGLTLSQSFHKILKGDRVRRSITFPEGFTNFQVLNLLKEAQGMRGDIVSSIKEGTLMPDTYYFYYDDTRESIISSMTKDMEKFLNDEWEKRGNNITLKDKNEALILASIIEKETKIVDERPIVSSVFNNRLKIGMPLQADPTVIYALKNGQTDYNYKLTHNDLKFTSLFNTYVTKGLPPTAICNPSRESIVAALHPQETNFLYFVADGTGGHTFAKSYGEHKKNIRG